MSYEYVQEVMQGKVLEQCMRVPYTRLPQLLGWSRASNRRLSLPGGRGGTSFTTQPASARLSCVKAVTCFKETRAHLPSTYVA